MERRSFLGTLMALVVAPRVITTATSVSQPAPAPVHSAKVAVMIDPCAQLQMRADERVELGDFVSRSSETGVRVARENERILGVVVKGAPKDGVAVVQVSNYVTIKTDRAGDGYADRE